MFAIAALIVFVLGLVLNVMGVGHSTLLLFLGLSFVAAHLIWAWTPWTGRAGAGNAG